jgi:hypothetical protein
MQLCFFINTEFCGLIFVYCKKIIFVSISSDLNRTSIYQITTEKGILYEIFKAKHKIFFPKKVITNKVIFLKWEGASVLS